MNKQYKLLKLIIEYYNRAKDAIAKGAPFGEIAELSVREKIGRFKYIEEEKIDDAFDGIMSEMKNEILELTGKGDEEDD